MEEMVRVITKILIWGAIFGIGALKLKWKAEEQEDIVSKISEEQRTRLEKSEVDFIQNNEWIQPGLIYKISGSNAKVLWYNRTIQEEFYRQIRSTDVKVKSAEQKAHDLQAGDFVKIHFKNGKISFYWD